MKKALILVVSLSLVSGCSRLVETQSLPKSALKGPKTLVEGELEPHERLVTVLATNDLHGSVEPSTDRNGRTLGGLAFWGGAVASIKQGLQARHGDHAGTVLVDGGDQFQGTLLSNFSEGLLMFRSMNEIGYDAVVPGNHDYDFGPIGWLEDQVTPTSRDQNPRGALERAVQLARFPLISANTFFKASLRDIAGRALVIDGSGCEVRGLAQGAGPADLPIDWSRSERPRFLQPYTIKEVAGVRVAMIGIDHLRTPTMTTIENVTDLCFRDEVESYLETRRELDGQADVFVLVMHNGNTSTETGATGTAQAIVDRGGADAVHAVVAGHTHVVHRAEARGVPVIQSGSGGDFFGRIDIVWDTVAHRVVTAKRRATAGIRLEHAADASFEGVRVVENAEVATLVGQARRDLDPLARRRLGTAPITLTRHRTDESLLANALTDVLREMTGAEIAFMNTGGIRTDLPAGDIRYEHLFEVLPFANRGVVVGPLPIETLVALVHRSMKTCGTYGALMQSGLRVTFEKDCSRGNSGSVDEQARILTIETIAGELLYSDGRVQAPGRTFRVATLDFLSAGGSGYAEFIGVPRISDEGIVREKMADYLETHPAVFPLRTDGRWRRVAPPRQP
jgi:5'-nucleotidase